MTSEVFEASPARRPFRERVMALAGSSTPSDHDVIHALAYGRQGRGDVGPDVAFALAMGRLGQAHTARVLRWLGGMLAGNRRGACGRLRPLAGVVAVHAFNAAVKGWHVPPAPDGVESSDWGEAILFACLLLEATGEDALALAARKRAAA
jgi:hypothetical protein